MNQHTDHRSTDHIVTKETTRMTLLARILHGISSHRAAAAVGVVAVLGAGALLPATPALAAQTSPWWHLGTYVRPAVLHPGEEGSIVARATNLGNEATSGASTISLELPPETEVVERNGVPQVSFYAFSKGVGKQDLGKAEFFGQPLGLCKIVGSRIDCTTIGVVNIFGNEISIEAVPPLNPYEFLELRVEVKAEAAAAGEDFEAEASGGGANPVTRRQPLPIGSAATAFGAEDYDLIPEAEGGAVEPRAGAHPYQLTADFNLNQNANEAPPEAPEVFGHAPATPRNLVFRLPPGQIGNALATPTCDALDFARIFGGVENFCDQSTVIGVATVTLHEALLGVVTYPVPLYNLTPAYGEPARFGFEVAQSPVILDTSVRSGPAGTADGDYGVSVTTRNTSQLVNFMSATTTFWGVPGDPSHDSSRGSSCLIGGHWTEFGRKLPCEPQEQEKPLAFLTLPTDCEAPFVSTVEGDSWTSLATPERQFLAPFTYSLEESGAPQPLVGCNQVPFAPTIHSEPTSNAATSPTGLSFDINVEDEGLLNPQGRAQSQMKKAVVTLPQGFTTNPSVAEGLKACTEAEYEAATMEANSGCTQESKVGEVTVQSPLVRPDQIVKGGIYVARQGLNPNHNLLTLYMIVREPEIGVLIKQALKVTPDPATGQLTTEVDSVPELPFSHFHLFFRPGQRAPLVTPSACGTYTVEADLYPWARPTEAVHRTSSFQITAGPEGQPCPTGGTPPFHPNLEAGTQNNAAGTYSPFYVHMSRKDSEQEITHFSIKLPPGVIGKLAGIAQCSDAAIAAAKAREHEGGGEEELQSPSCPQASEVGRTLVGTGVGNVLAYAPGKLYLAGPYHGSAISIVSITAAKVGPFDLGTVVVREALKVNPETAEVFVDATGSDPIPHIVDGIPVHLRDIRIYVNRPEFVLNPTGCERTSTASTVLGSGLNFASESDDNPITVTSPFQAADCAALGFHPTLKLRLKGKTKRGAFPALRAELTQRPGEAAISRARVTLPHSEFLEQGHIRTVCTRVQFAAGAGDGTSCPAASVYGHAMAITPLLDQPLEGPVFLRSNPEHELPDLVAALHGSEINVDLVGRIDSLHGQIRNTFEAVPDAPVSSFTLEMQGGRKGLLVNSTNLCEGTHRAIVDFTGHNGKISDTTPAVGARCRKGHKRHRHAHRGHRR